ncbi:MAG: hypothetical protein H0U04_18120 [Rubrobacter sp.]|nr:hypothetical protein [Rubrobacter sp.]
MSDNVKKSLAAGLLAAMMFAAGCSEEDPPTATGGPTGATSEPTPSASAFPTTGLETTMETGTLESPGGGPEVVLRVEGDSGVTFSGLCNVGDEEAVLGGGPVPKRYAFDPHGEQLSCKIQKKDPGDGDLKVTLLAGGSTHSVQQINTLDGVINVSYAGG